MMEGVLEDFQSGFNDVEICDNTTEGFCEFAFIENDAEEFRKKTVDLFNSLVSVNLCVFHGKVMKNATKNDLKLIWRICPEIETLNDGSMSFYARLAIVPVYFPRHTHKGLKIGS